MFEKEIERRMCEFIKRRGGLTYKFTSPASPGMPDRIVITPAGVVWFVELKTANGRISPIQGWQIARLREQKANVRVVRGLGEAEQFVEEVLPHGV